MIKPGSRWKSVVCSAEAVLVRVPNQDGVPQCGGVDMVPLGEQVTAREAVDGFDGGCVVGKRFRSEKFGIELLCTKAGKGTLGFAGEALQVVAAKSLPSSD